MDPCRSTGRVGASIDMDVYVTAVLLACNDLKACCAGRSASPRQRGCGRA